MGGAAASSAMGYLGACSPANLEAKAPDLPLNTDFSGMGQAGAYHTCSPAMDSPHFNSFDFEVADSDFDSFDCGGFTFWSAAAVDVDSFDDAEKRYLVLQLWLVTESFSMQCGF